MTKKSSPSSENVSKSLAKTISGFVIDSDGNPVENATVYSMPPFSKSYSYHRERTDKDGRWEVNTIAAEDLSQSAFYAVHRGYRQSETAYLSNSLTRSNFVNGKHALTLLNGLPLRGWVHNEAGEPLHGANITGRELRNNELIWHTHTRSDMRGEFLIQALAPGRNVVTVRMRGYASMGVVLVVSNNSPPIDIVLRRGRKVRIQVADSEGRPLPGARVISHRIPETEKYLTAPAYTEVLGEISLRGSTDYNGIALFTNAPNYPLSFRISCDGYGTNILSLEPNAVTGVIKLPALE